MKIEILMIFMIFSLYCLNNYKVESNDKFFEKISIVENPETMIRIIRHDRHVYKHDIWKSELLDLKVINEKSINLYAEVGYDNLMNTIIVSFRGTKYTNDKGFPDFHNILTDLNIGLVEYNSLCEDCKVHKGFLKSFTLVKDRVFTAINELKNEFSCTSIVFTGHSYGGSLAVLSSITYFKTLNLLGLNDEITLLTFGQPRTGNKRIYQIY